MNSNKTKQTSIIGFDLTIEVVVEVATVLLLEGLPTLLEVK